MAETTRTVFHPWWMFSLGQLESWLQAQAAQGWWFAGVRAGWWFTFRQTRPSKTAYRVDYRGYLVDGYLQELDRMGWKVQKLSRSWQILYQDYQENPPELFSGYDERMAQGLGRNSITVFALIAAIAIYDVVMLDEEHDSLAFRVLVAAVGLAGFVNLLRMTLARAMYQERVRRHAETKR
jgi:hypothetical protein